MVAYAHTYAYKYNYVNTYIQKCAKRGLPHTSMQFTSSKILSMHIIVQTMDLQFTGLRTLGNDLSFRLFILDACKKPLFANSVITTNICT